jgi:hypothetical protein
MVDSEDSMMNRYLAAKSEYGDRMRFTGLNCRLISRPP